MCDSVSFQVLGGQGAHSSVQEQPELGGAISQQPGDGSVHKSVGRISMGHRRRQSEDRLAVCSIHSDLRRLQRRRMRGPEQQ